MGGHGHRSGHGRFGGTPQRSHGQPYGPGYGGPDRQAYGGGGGFRPPRPLVWTLVVAGLVVWTLLAWIGYAVADGVIGWLAASAGPTVEAGRNLAGAVGVGKEVGAALDSVNAGGLLGGALNMLQAVLKPAIVMLWAAGALAIVAAPWILSRLGGRLLGASRWSRH